MRVATRDERRVRPGHGRRARSPRCCVTQARGRRHASTPFDGDDAIERAAADAVAAAPDRLVVAGGDGSIGPVASAAARRGRPARGHPDGHGERLRPRARPAADLEAALDAGRGPPTRERPRRRCSVAGDRPFLNAASSVGLSVVGRAPRPAAQVARSAARLRDRRRCARGSRRAAALITVNADGGQSASRARRGKSSSAGTGAFGGGSELDARRPVRPRWSTCCARRAGPRVELVRRAWGMRAAT